MAPEGMVHALEQIKRLIRSDGVLLDIHPARVTPTIEVHAAGRIVLAEDSPDFDYDDDLRSADDAVAWAIQHRVFALDRGHEFEFVTYASTIAELRDFFAVAGAYDQRERDDATQRLVDELDARIDAAMRGAGDGAEVAYRERARMARLLPAA
jgi:hypothetical protein